MRNSNTLAPGPWRYLDKSLCSASLLVSFKKQKKPSELEIKQFASSIDFIRNMNDFQNLSCSKAFNSLSANPTKWSNTIKQFVGNLPTNCLNEFDHFVGLALIGLNHT